MVNDALTSRLSVVLSVLVSLDIWTVASGI
jgi:hypothetical protein